MRPSLLVIILCAGCFDPHFPTGTFLCGSGSAECPPGTTCQGGVCKNGNDTVIDGGGGGTVDAPVGTADARRFDARPFPDAPRPIDGSVCAPGTFVSCQSETEAVVCGPNNTFEIEDCAFRCNPDAQRCEQCDPSKSKQCAGDILLTCSSTGLVSAMTPCTGQTFCSAPDMKCAILSPSNLPASMCDTPAATPRTFTANQPIDTDACTGGTKVTQSGGAPTICVLRHSTIVIESGVDLTAVGRNALALVATNTFDLNGGIDVSAPRMGDGSGSTEKGAGGVDSTRWSSAGGGGGYGTAGAAGGTEEVLVTIPPGPSYGNPELIPLQGGSAGGRGGSQNTICDVNCPVIAKGGGGGGAVQLVACKQLRFGTLSAVGAAGAGGEGGFAAVVGSTQLTSAGGGGGGGSGGAVLIESPNISASIITIVYATGGGGGGGGGLEEFDRGGRGSDGNDSSPAFGGGRGAAFAGRGGAGGTHSGAQGDEGELPVTGETVQAVGYGSGAGGGAAGRIRVNTRADFEPGSVPGAFLPLPTIGIVKSH